MDASLSECRCLNLKKMWNLKFEDTENMVICYQQGFLVFWDICLISCVLLLRLPTSATSNAGHWGVGCSKRQSSTTVSLTFAWVLVQLQQSIIGWRSCDWNGGLELSWTGQIKITHNLRCPAQSKMVGNPIYWKCLEGGINSSMKAQLLC